MKVWVSYLDAGNKPHQALGLEEIVSVVEPKKKYFDPELIGLYIIGAAIISFIVYLYLPAKKALPTIPEPELVPAKNLRPIKAPKIVEIGENGGEDEWVSKDILKSIAKGKGGQGNGGLKNRK